MPSKCLQMDYPNPRRKFEELFIPASRLLELQTAQSQICAQVQDELFEANKKRQSATCAWATATSAVVQIAAEHTAWRYSLHEQAQLVHAVFSARCPWSDATEMKLTELIAQTRQSRGRCSSPSMTLNWRHRCWWMLARTCWSPIKHRWVHIPSIGHQSLRRARYRASSMVDMQPWVCKQSDYLDEVHTNRIVERKGL